MTATHDEAKGALDESEERFRLLVESVKDYAIFMLDPQGVVSTWNVGAARIKGYAAHEIIGKHFSTFYPREDVEAGKCERELAVAAEVGRFEDEGWRVRKDGKTFWANVVITAVRDRRGRLLGFAKVTRDLTERRRHEDQRIELARAEEGRRLAEAAEERSRRFVEELRVARDRAEEATRIKDDFLATVSHELRTPLNAMLGWARMLLSGSVPEEKRARALETIVRNANAQNHIIEDLLDMSRIISGNLRLEVDALDINRVVSEALEVVRPAADAKGVALEWQTNADAGLIKGDADRLRQVLWNLLSNAVKFTPGGGRVRVALERRASSVEIAVSDTGQGICADFLPRVFDRFSQQESSHTRKAGGLGLGLAIVKHLVELHGGTVEAHSPGEAAGATFVVKLPLAPVRASDPDPGAGEIAAADARTPPDLGGLHVLVLDDDVDARELIQAVLEGSGAVVTAASSSSEALEKVRRRPPDVIVSDIGMPGDDGYTFVRRLRALPREEGGRIPAVALTAYARVEDRRKALLSGFQNHAAKPIEPQELLIVVANLAGRYQ